MRYKAIPTKYYKADYRARGEARYATWCDVLHLPYMFEPYDIYLPHINTRYLPDFFHPTLSGDLVVEVKGAGNKHVTELEKQKCWEFAFEMEDTPILLFAGGFYRGDYATSLYRAVYPFYRCIHCKKASKSAQGYKYFCDNCNNAFVEPDPAYRTVRVESVQYYEDDIDTFQREVGITNCDWKAPMCISPAYPQGPTSLGFAGQIASRARYEFEQKWDKSYYDLLFPFINPAFLTQRFTEAEVLNANYPFIFDTASKAQEFIDMGFSLQEWNQNCIFFYNRVITESWRRVSISFLEAVENLKATYNLSSELLHMLEILNQTSSWLYDVAKEFDTLDLSQESVEVLSAWVTYLFWLTLSIEIIHTWTGE